MAHLNIMVHALFLLTKKYITEQTSTLNEVLKNLVTLGDFLGRKSYG